ncbi:hypothetical protein CNR22_17945 [Sphingobacteriaceae bacterium]|nr:hypothetical protein CNR22_17945 [Sphingobacteriaceae bacterium]
MLRFFLYLGFIVLLKQGVFAQSPQRTGKPLAKPQLKPAPKKHSRTTNLAFGLGVTRSVVYLARNVKPDNDATGLHSSVLYGGKKLFRVSLEYTRYKTINIEPTWYNIRASVIELNGHLLARFKSNNAYFYPLFGISYNLFSGTYTGINDYLNLSSLYAKNQKVNTRWWGFNIGTGYEFYFKPGSLFLDYKMRVGITEGKKQLNIQDVCITAGLRINLKVRSLYGIFIYRGTRSRYMLDKSDED